MDIPKKDGIYAVEATEHKPGDPFPSLVKADSPDMPALISLPTTPEPDQIPLVEGEQKSKFEADINNVTQGINEMDLDGKGLGTINRKINEIITKIDEMQIDNGDTSVRGGHRRVRFQEAI